MRLSRSTAIISAILLSLLLPSCAAGGEDEELAKTIQDEFQNAQSVYFSSDIRADYGQRVFDFGVTYSGSAGKGTLTVTEPEIIAGVAVDISDGGATLEYDGAEVYTGEILPDGLSPVDAPPMLLKAWSEGLITETVSEDWEGSDCLAALFRIDERTDMRTWFDEKTSLPLHAEVYFDGYMVLSFNFFDVKVE